MFAKHLTLNKARKYIICGLNRIDSSDNLEEVLPFVSQDTKSPLFKITKSAADEFDRLNRTGDLQRLSSENLRRALHFGIAEQVSKLKSSLALLATTASTAPFIGLFGTVWGIMNSFTAIAQMKSVSLATVAPGIAEALIATAVGLFVAIPAVCGYNIFRSRLAEIEGLCINYAGHLLNRLQHESNIHQDGLCFARGE